MWRLRSFLNVDTPSLEKIWNAHHLASNSRSLCPVNVWDQCVLSKVYFHADDFVVAVDSSDNLIGFVHFGPSLEPNSEGFSTNKGLIHRLCVIPGPDDQHIAADLINHATSKLAERGMHSCHALGTPLESTFYLGLSDGDNLLGVASNDTRLVAWLNETGFKAESPTECWELNLDSFRPPMDRQQISIRRTCTIGRILDDYHPNWWISTILGHCDQVRFNLMVRGDASSSYEIMLWYPDSTIRGVDSATVRLRLPPIPADDEGRERFICLIAEALRQLQQERKRTVRVVATADQIQSLRLLQRLGFRSMAHGLIFGKPLPKGA